VLEKGNTKIGMASENVTSQTNVNKRLPPKF